MTSVASWMHRVVTTGSWRTFDDLHVDEIDPDLDRERWIAAALRNFEPAVALRDAEYLQFAVVLGFALASHKTDWASFAELFDDLDEWSPPSLYLFDSTTDALDDALSDATAVPAPAFAPADCQAFARFPADADGSPVGSLLFVSRPIAAQALSGTSR